MIKLSITSFCILITQYSFSQNCLLTSVLDIDPQTGETYRKTEYHYDKQGKLISWKDSSEYFVEYIVAYDENGKVFNYKEGEPGIINFTHYYSYDNTRVHKIEHNNDFDVCQGITLYSYDEQGRVSEVKEMDIRFDTTIILQENYFYLNNSAKNPFKKIGIMEYGSDTVNLTYDNKRNPYSLLGKTLGTWEENNILTEESKGNYASKLTYTYNRYNLPDEVIIYDDGVLNYKKKYTYMCK